MSEYDSNVARTPTTVMAGTALGISLFDLLFGGLSERRGGEAFAGLRGRGAGIAQADECLAYLDAEFKASKEINALQIENAKKDALISDMKMEERIARANTEVEIMRSRLHLVERFINVTPALSTTAVSLAG
jgi:hypothetical protein